jgi:hypothetical protein
MFGGGSAIENEGRSLFTSAMPTPSSSQRARQRGSTSEGEKDLSMRAPGRARSIEADACGPNPSPYVAATDAPVRGSRHRGRSGVSV